MVLGGCELCSVAVMSDDRTEMRARAVERRQRGTGGGNEERGEKRRKRGFGDFFLAGYNDVSLIYWHL